MIKKAKYMCLFAVAGLLCADFAMADSVVVNGDVLYYTSDGFLNIDLVPGGSLPSSCPVGTALPITPIPVLGATADSDIVVSGGHAFVRTGNTVASVPIAPVCLANEFHNVGECIAYVDSVTGNLTVPCVVYQGKFYEAVLEQRGSSSNWELFSALPNDGFRNYPVGNQFGNQ